MWQRFEAFGHTPDLNTYARPADSYYLAENMIPQGQGMEGFRMARFIWEDAGYVPSGDMQFLQYCPSASGSPLWFGGSGIIGQSPEVFSWTGNSAFAYTNRTRAAWAALGTVPRRNIWTGGLINGQVVVNCGFTHYPESWDPTAAPATTVQLAGWNAWEVAIGGAIRCRALRPYKYHLIAMNMTRNAVRFPTQVCWSSAAAYGLPTAWLPAAGNDAGDVSLADTHGEVVDGARLGESFFLYKESACYRMTYVGGSQVMQIDKVSDTVGAMSQNCIVDIGGAHAVLTRGDVVLISESGEVKSIAAGSVQRYLFEQTGQNNQNVGFITYNPSRRHLWVFGPGSLLDTAGLAHVYDVDTGRWGFVEMNFTGNSYGPTCAGIGPAGEQTTGQDTVAYRAVIGFGAGLGAGPPDTMEDRWLSLNDVDAIPPDLVTVSGEHGLRYQQIDFGEPDRRKLLKGFRPLMDGFAGEVVNVYLTTHQSRTDAGVNTGPFSFVFGTDDRVDLLSEGVSWDLLVSFTPTNLNEQFNFRGFELEYEIQGRF
jgi:hypothetical protein